MMILDKLSGMLYALRQSCRRLCSCLQVSPLVFVLVTAAVLLLVSLILVFNICLARLFTVPGALILNLCICWLLLRLVVRVLVFPGSIVLWKRNTEASYRVEMAKQFAHHLEQLHTFLLMTSGRAPAVGSSVTMEGAVLGCMVVEGLARNFRVQQRDQVRFTAEQAQVRLLVQGVEGWLNEAKVLDKSGSSGQIPLTDWMQRMSQSLVPVPLVYAVASTPLEQTAKSEAPACIEKVEQLMQILDALQRQQDSCLSNFRRFLRVPTVGSLHQLRAELLVRYSGKHYWVRASGGRKIDAMFLSCQPGEGNSAPAEEAPLSEGLSSVKEDVPLKDLVGDQQGYLGPVVVWCNPNAAYYETMAYESHWLDFYLSQGCSVFLFNYSGFGRSAGSPTPSALAADGHAVIDFLRRRGFRNVGVHGRSIGGIAACSLAQAHSDIVKVLVADRTFSTLSKAAKYTFGNWASQGLALSATWADNSWNYLHARCYKVMICDPKDATIPDLAALRTSVALEALQQMEPSDRLTLEDDKAKRLAEAWQFFDVLFSLCDRDEGRQCQGCGRQPAMAEAKRPARQPVVGKPSSDGDKGSGGEEDTQRLVAAGREVALGAGAARSASSSHAAPRCTVNAQWLEDHVETVRAVLSPHVDGIRLALDIAGTQLNSSGMTLDDALGRPVDEACHAIKCFLANIQVWGSLGSLSQPLCPANDKDIELLMQKGLHVQEYPELLSRLTRLSANLTPDRIAAYHRQISRSLVAHVRREFRQCFAQVRCALEAPPGREEAPAGADLRAAVLASLREVEGLLTSIYRFFKCVDIAAAGAAGAGAGTPAAGERDYLFAPPLPATDPSASDDSEEGGREASQQQPARPTVDRNVIGHVMCIDCGHNGVLSDGEVHHLTLHLRAAKFGKYADDRSIP